MKTIDVTKYGVPHPTDKTDLYFVDGDIAKKAVEQERLFEVVMEGKVDVVFPEARGTYRGNRISDEFIRGLVGQVAREVGIDVFIERVSINGFSLRLYKSQWDGTVANRVYKYLEKAAKAKEKAAKAKARATDPTVWSGARTLMLPDIGTVLRLEEDWAFRLYEEYRNEKFLNGIGVKGVDCWKRYKGGQMRMFDVVIKAGSELGVDRVYIRKGADEYSSLTFNLHKGGVAYIFGKDIKAHGRFWAKLSDVNRMVVRVDTKTLADN